MVDDHIVGFRIIGEAQVRGLATGNFQVRWQVCRGRRPEVEQSAERAQIRLALPPSSARMQQGPFPFVRNTRRGQSNDIHPTTKIDVGKVSWARLAPSVLALFPLKQPAWRRTSVDISSN